MVFLSWKAHGDLTGMNDNKYEKGINSIQDRIIQFVTNFPGIRYRELLRVTGVSNGVLSYHLNLLDNSGKVRVQS